MNNFILLLILDSRAERKPLVIPPNKNQSMLTRWKNYTSFPFIFKK